MYKLICSDLDDTLIGTKGQIGKNLKQAIKDYTARGGKFCVVTGRMTTGAIPICNELDLHGELISYQGAFISDIDTGKVYFEKTIPNEKAIQISEFLEGIGCYFQTYRNDEFITKNKIEFSNIYAQLSHAKCIELKENVSEYLKREKFDPLKILAMAKPEKVPDILTKMRAEFGKEFLINTSKPYIIEVVPHGTNKGYAVQLVAKKYGIKQEEIVCVGDSENDLTMIEYAGVGVVVGSGTEQAKAKADVIAPGCDEDAITWVIEKFGV